MSSDRVERRAVPRTIYAGQALVFLNNQQFSCRALDISTRGLLLVPPTRAPVGTFLRMHVSLPGLDEVVDIDGLVVRETENAGFYAWGVVFHRPSQRSLVVLSTFVDWVVRSQREERQIVADFKTSGGLAAVRQAGTGPAHPQVMDAKRGSSARVGAGSSARVGAGSSARVGAGSSARVGAGSSGSRLAAQSRDGEELGARPAPSPAPAALRRLPPEVPGSASTGSASLGRGSRLGSGSRPQSRTGRAGDSCPAARESDELRELYRAALADMDKKDPRRR